MNKLINKVVAKENNQNAGKNELVCVEFYEKRNIEWRLFVFFWLKMFCRDFNEKIYKNEKWLGFVCFIYFGMSLKKVFVICILKRLFENSECEKWRNIISM